MARPKKNINEAQVLKLAAMGCSGEEIAAVVGCSRDLIYKNFSTALKEGQEKRNCSLRRAQYDVGVNKKNPTMLIWLGKQFLGQADKQELEHSGGVQLVNSIPRPKRD